MVIVVGEQERAGQGHAASVLHKPGFTSTDYLPFPEKPTASWPWLCLWALVFRCGAPPGSESESTAYSAATFLRRSFFPTSMFLCISFRTVL